MTWPGPASLGRGIVVGPGQSTPAPWRDIQEVVIDDEVFADPAALEAAVDRLHRAWVRRAPTVVVWGAGDPAPERSTAPPYELTPEFLFPVERARFLAFTNSYDARDGTPRWWWAHKAASRTGAVAGGPADVVLPDGSPAWIDGGPRHPLVATDHPVIHGETTDAGRLVPVPEPTPPDRDGLADDQWEAVKHLAGPARIIAPAGSGKTRTLAARLGHVLRAVGIEPDHLVAVAYNAGAAAELRDRTGADRSTVRTIHSLGWAILSDARPQLTLIDEHEVRSVMGRLVSVPQRANQDPMSPYLEALEEARLGLVDPAVVEADRDDIPGFTDAFERYRERLYRAGRIDFGEQIYGAIEVLLREPELRAKWQRRCRHLLVDEFQDMTPAYVLLLRLVASPQLSVFAVGDDDQVIYGYAGADPGFLIDFDRYFPGAGTHALETNYRCPPPVVNAAVNLLSHNQRRIPKTISAALERPLDWSIEVVRAPGPGLGAKAAAIVHAWVDEGVAPADIAVLSRVNSSLIPVKAALTEVGIPTADLLTGDVMRRTMVRALFAWIRLATSPDTMARNDVLEAVRRPGRGLNRLAQEILPRVGLDVPAVIAAGAGLDGRRAERWDDFCADLAVAIRAATRQDALDLVQTIVSGIGLGTSAQTLDSGRGNAAKSGHFDDLVAIERAAALHPQVDGFHEWLRSCLGRTPDADGVTLSTVHRVKGMEWQRVIVFGADRGSMPHTLSVDLEEERRIFHVAITRASRQVAVLVDEERPSRFLAELEKMAPARPATPVGEPAPQAVATPAVLSGDLVAVSGGYRGRVVSVGKRIEVELETGAVLSLEPAEIREVVERVGGSPDLVAALKEWRRETASRSSVPAYVVLHDATIEELARIRPTTEAQLLEVAGIGPRKLEDYGDDLLEIIAGSD